MPPEKSETENRPDVDLPILNISELSRAQIDAVEVPPDVQAKLKPWEKVVYVGHPEVKWPSRSPSAMKELMKLTGVKQLSQIGSEGHPSVASLASEANSQLEAMTKYQALHSRDALRVAMDLHLEYPNLLASTIVSLAEKQGVVDEQYVPGQPLRQEEIGRIMLLDRPPGDKLGQKFTKELEWGWPFYGSIDATPSYISALATYVLEHDENFLYRTYDGRDGRRHTISESFFAALAWLLKKIEETSENPEGLLEFKNKTPEPGMGMLNQAWQDNASAYVHGDGSWANHQKGIAAVEVQALVYDSLLDAAQVYKRLLKNESAAARLEEQAEKLRKTVLEKFWTDEKGGYFVQGTDRDEKGNLRQLKVRGSNMGHLLNSKFLEGDDPNIARKREAIIRQLFSSELLSPHGLRTLANDEVAFREEGYHTGSVWLWVSGYVAKGLERHGYNGLAWQLRKNIFDTVWQTGSFPEFVKGDSDTKVHLNDREIYVYDSKNQSLYLYEQVPQEIQAWSVSVVLAMKYDHRMPKAAADPVKRQLEEELIRGK
ncbi:MAG TPA: amylo-alpha-1,6-glucosidase [Candidatus Saccharimonadales bacterium]|nr:amylo-alpha-1,6-glucosidase [Candidatus Saccharimonadales bacterium]